MGNSYKLTIKAQAHTGGEVLSGDDHQQLCELLEGKLLAMGSIILPTSGAQVSIIIDRILIDSEPNDVEANKG